MFGRLFFVLAFTLELTRQDFEKAGELGNQLRRKGHKVPVTDALIASLCLRLKIPLYYPRFLF
jgi:predicted nucleic acid-binding protein